MLLWKSDKKFYVDSHVQKIHVKAINLAAKFTTNRIALNSTGIDLLNETVVHVFYRFLHIINFKSKLIHYEENYIQSL